MNGRGCGMVVGFVLVLSLAGSMVVAEGDGANGTDGGGNNTTMGAEDREVLDLHAFESLGFLLAVGIGIAMLIFILRRKQGEWVFLFVLAGLMMAVPEVEASGHPAPGYGWFGHDAMEAGGLPLPADADGLYACWLFVDAGPVRAGKDAPNCTDMPPGMTHWPYAPRTLAGAVVFDAEPRDQRQPGVGLLVSPGDGLALPASGADATVGVVLDRSDARVALIDPVDLGVIGIAARAGETTVEAPADGWPLGVWVVVEANPGGDTVRVLWEDPDFYPKSPSVGEIAAVVLGAALLTVWRAKPRSGMRR